MKPIRNELNEIRKEYYRSSRVTSGSDEIKKCYSKNCSKKAKEIGKSLGDLLAKEKKLYYAEFPRNLSSVIRKHKKLIDVV